MENMEIVINLHNRYLTAPCGLSTLKLMDKFANEDVHCSIQNLILSHNEYFLENHRNFQILEELRTLLCCEYQLIHESSHNTITLNFEGSSIFLFITDTFLLETNNQFEENKSLIFDILILQLAMHSNTREIIRSFKYFYNNMENYGDMRLLIEVSECLINALLLNISVHDNFERSKPERTEICMLLLMKITTWFPKVENTNFKSFISLISKTIVTCDTTMIISSLWKMILTNTDGDQSLKLFCNLMDIFFSFKSDEIIQMNISNINNKRFWNIIQLQLLSTIQQQRMQAQHIMKEVIEFANKNVILLEDSIEKKIPFVDLRNQPIIVELKNHFFSIIENLEEGKDSRNSTIKLHLEILIRFHIFFDTIWLQIIFQRIISYENDDERKCYLFIMLKMDPTIFNEEFLFFLAEVLNNNFLYYEPKEEGQLQVSKALSQLFRIAEKKNVKLINDFIIAASRIPFWHPAPLFWMIEALISLKDINIKCNSWTFRELKALTLIVDESITKHPEELQKVLFHSLAVSFAIYTTSSIPISLLSKTFISNNHFYEQPFRATELFDYGVIKLTTTDAIEYVLDHCENLMNKNSEIDIHLFIKMLFFLWSSSKIFISEFCPAKFALSSMFSIFIGINEKPYDSFLCERAFELIASLSKTFYWESLDFLGDARKEHFDGVFNFLSTTLEPPNCPTTYKQVSIYMERLEEIVRNSASCKSDNSLKKLHLKARKVLKTVDLDDIQFWHVAGVLYHSGEFLGEHEKYFNINYAHFLLKLCRKSMLTRIKKTESSKYILEHYGILSDLIKQFLSEFQFVDDLDIEEETDLDMEFLELLLKLVETGSERVIYLLSLALTAMISHRELIFGEDCIFIMKEEISTLIRTIVDSAWKQIWSMKRTKLFWYSTTDFLNFIINHSIIRQDSLKYVNDMLRRTKNLPEVRLQFLDSLPSKPENIQDFQKEILHSFLYTDSETINNRIESQILHFARNNLEIYSAPSEMVVRYKAVTHIISMIKFNPEVICQTYIPILLAVLEEYKNRIYSANSSIHFLKNRTMQILLILQPFFNDDNTLKIHEAICQCIIEESNEPSIRIMQEWLLIKIHIKSSEYQDKFWDMFTKAQESRQECIISLVSIVYHVWKILSINEKKAYFEKALVHILPGCMAQQFGVKLHCQTILLQIFQINEELPCPHCFKCTAIKNSLEFGLRQGNMMEPSEKLLNDFYFSKFDPIKDYDFQTIFYDLPRLLNVSLDECICPKIMDLDEKHTTVLPICNRDKLKSLKTSS